MSNRPEGFDYQRYLASREWAVLREEVRRRSRNRCESCFLLPQQAVHHLTYERIGHENINDLMAVCNPCHEYLSGKSNEDPSSIYTVTPAWIPPALAEQGYTSTQHYLLPAYQYFTEEFTGTYRVRTAWCRGSLCLWCPRVDEDFMLQLDDLVLQPYSREGR